MSLLANDAFASGLIESLNPNQRRQLAKKIALSLRASQQKRIANQLNPDGSRFTPRKLRNQKGRVRRKMFNKIRMNKYLKAKSNADAATIHFSPAANRIATVHQYGLRDFVAKNSKIKIQYPERELLGFTDSDIQMVEDIIIDTLAGSA